MASVESRNGSYRVIFRYAGKKFSRSLETRHVTEARASLVRLEDNLRRLALGLLVCPAEADLCSFLLSDGRLPSKPKLSAVQTLEDLCTSYFAGIPTGNLEESTRSGMQIHARHLRRILGRSLVLETVNPVNLQQYIARRCSEKTRSKRLISPTTTKKELETLRTMWNWALMMGHVDRPFPGRGLKFPKLESKPPFRTLSEIEDRISRGGLSKVSEAKLWESAFLSLPEIGELLSHVKVSTHEPYLYPMVVFAAHTGARRSEMLRSEIDDIDLKNRSILIRERKRVRGMKSTRVVPVSKQLSSVLRDWLVRHPGGNHTFCADPTGVVRGRRRLIAQPLTPNELHKHFRRVLANSRFSNLRGLHVFRHSFCSNCAARGIDQRVINAWVGHQSEEMVQRYRHLLPTQSRESIELVFGTKSD